MKALAKLKAKHLMVLIALMLCISLGTTVGDPGEPGDVGPTPSPSIPLQDGMPYLVAAAAGYAIIRLKQG